MRDTNQSANQMSQLYALDEKAIQAQARTEVTRTLARCPFQASTPRARAWLRATAKTMAWTWENLRFLDGGIE